MTEYLISYDIRSRMRGSRSPLDKSLPEEVAAQISYVESSQLAKDFNSRSLRLPQKPSSREI